MNEKSNSSNEAGSSKRIIGEREERDNYISAKKNKLIQQFIERKASLQKEIEDADESVEKIFNGLSFHINGYTIPSFDKLKKMILLHGGIFHQYYSKTKTNYMIATNLPFAKIKELKEEKIVKPEWLVDCVNQSQLLDYQPYLLYPTKSLKNQPSINELININSNQPTNFQTSSLPLYNHKNVELPLNSEPNVSTFGELPLSLEMLDQDALNNLSSEIKDEIMAYYNQSSNLSSIIPSTSKSSTKIVIKKSKKTNTAKVLTKNKPGPVFGPLDYLLKSQKENQSEMEIMNVYNTVKSVCGEKELKTVINIVREWVETEEDLNDEDLAYILRYFNDLIEDKEYDHLKLVMTSFFEAVSKKNSKSWKDAYNTIIQIVSTELNQGLINLKKIELPVFNKNDQH